MWYKLGILGVLFSATQSLLAVCSMGESPVANPQVIAVGIHGGLFLTPPANSSLSEWWMEIPASFLGNFAGAGDARMLCCHKCPQTQNQVLWSGLSSLLADSRLVLFYFLGVKTLSFSCQFRKILLSSSPVLSPIGICSLSSLPHSAPVSVCHALAVPSSSSCCLLAKLVVTEKEKGSKRSERERVGSLTYTHSPQFSALSHSKTLNEGRAGVVN